MLELKAITKDYPAGGGVVRALKGIDLRFRQNEFVSILGPSGCGKTTMLNLIGGLDHYTSGDLIINGRSTKDYKDRDWDTYRNHSIGFVFQTYNLIPHQTVLQNVELALTLSGVPKAERRKRAKEALEKVGLADQLRKKPSEMSGGQMQRVAIARAIVNNPDIILADEPTGALDTETSVQVMEILKEIARDRLVIMVTHNPDLAEQYSTRIIRMLDGVITDDSMPVSDEELASVGSEKTEKTETKRKQKIKKKPSMSIFTAFGLSLKNLFTKKGRTMLTSFAGSIGIIGIALIYAVSQGTTNYIDAVQEDTLASYPLTLEAEHMDLGEMLETFSNTAKSKTEHERDAVYSKAVVYDMLNTFNTMQAEENDLSSFKTYLEEERNTVGTKFNQSVTGVQYSYDLDLMVYTKNADGSVYRSDTTELLSELMKDYFGMDFTAMSSMGTGTGNMSLLNMGNSRNNLWQEMLPGEDDETINPLLKKQYEIINKGGYWPNAYNEIALVVDENNELSDMALYALGLKKKEDITQIMEAMKTGETLEPVEQKWSYEEICAMEFRAIPNGECYAADPSGIYSTDLGTTETGCKYLYDSDKAIPLKVTAIIREKKDTVSGMLKGSIVYTNGLTKELILRADDSKAVQTQTENPMRDIFTGLPFKAESAETTDAQKAAEFKKYIEALDDAGKAKIYKAVLSIPDPTEMGAFVEQQLKQFDRAKMEEIMLPVLAKQVSMDADKLKDYLTSMSDEDLANSFKMVLGEQYKAARTEAVEKQFATVPVATLAQQLQQLVSGSDKKQLSAYYDAGILTFSESTLKDNLIKLGKIDLKSPSAINLYAKTFADKDNLEAGIKEYNDKNDEAHKISYTDYVGLLMSSVTTVIDAIAYVLIAFVAVSLIVSSIMIGVITLISVQERTKEIGILRAIGASKRNVSSMFNAETVLIGFAAGFVGVAITYLLCIPINMILHHLTGLNNLSATLPPQTAVVLILISMLLTLIAGIIPSRSAAKKDPVVALRTE